ncbi:predicted protein [Nematostella vectensis]|uniref:ILEI/PANDER domain-containing protein n=1 Tax=Nematostella vectensis TaxID=45351 RepID=A7REP4_NEMVE|nr:predicted protein [Nematostella vectensis]|eukprot:XP_001642010.1 predicted protein [Nematostella vectensis]
MEPNCASFNFGLASDGKMTCELNNNSAKDPGELKDKVGFVYQGYKDMCEATCYMEPNCASFNFGLASDGKMTCELNNNSAKDPGELKDKVGFIYQGYKNTCGSSKCLSGSFCQTGYGEKNHRSKYITVNVKSYAKGSFHGLSEIIVDGTDYCLKQRGHNFAAFSMNGTFISKANFDTYGSATADDEMRDYINDLPSNSLVIISTYDSAERHVADAYNALRSLGAVEPLKSGYRGTWFLIGHKGGPRPWITQGNHESSVPSMGSAHVQKEGCFAHASLYQQWCNP